MLFFSKITFKNKINNRRLNMISRVYKHLTYGVDDFVRYVGRHNVVCTTAIDAKNLHTLCSKSGISCKIDEVNKTCVVFDKAMVIAKHFNSDGFELVIEEFHTVEVC